MIDAITVLWWAIALSAAALLAGGAYMVLFTPVSPVSYLVGVVAGFSARYIVDCHFGQHRWADA